MSTTWKAAAAIAAVCLWSTATFAVGMTVTVTPSNMNNWSLSTTDNASNTPGSGSGTGVAELVSGPATPPLGSGSAHLMTGPGHGDESAQLRNAVDWVGTRMDELTELGYSTYATAWNGQQLPYVTIYVDTDGDTSYDDRLWFEPAYSESDAGNSNPYTPQGPAALDVWQTWDMLQGMWYSDNYAGPGSNAVTLTDYLTNYAPNARIVDAPGGLGGIRIASGYASPGDDFNAYVDAFTIGTSAGTTTYNFEVPEPASIVLLVGVVVGGLWMSRNGKLRD
jgi:hypothetical protein